MSFFKKNSFMKKEKVDNPLEDFSIKQQLELKGTILAELFFSEESGFGIYSLETDIGEVKLKGTFVHELEIGSSYLFGGYVAEYNKEKQLQVLHYKPITPYSKRGVIAYLSTLKGLKKTRANNIYQMYGNDSIEILLTDPIRISKNISGIGEKSVLNWQKQLEEQRESEELMIELMGYGLKAREIRKLYKDYDFNLAAKIKENPYFLASEVKGYGFKKCDELAMNIGYKHDKPERIQSGILYGIEKTCHDNGHTFLTNEEFFKTTTELLSWVLTESVIKNALNEQSGDVVTIKFGQVYYSIPRANILGKKEYVLESVSQELIVEAVEALVKEEKLVLDDGKVYLSKFYYLELINKKHFKRLNGKVKIPTKVTLDEYLNHLDEYLKKNSIELEKKQYDAVVSIGYCIGGMHMLNGSAGCGKTFVLKIISYMINWLYAKEGIKVKYSLFAPTGKASKVASKAMDAKFSTIHRGLEFNPQNGYNFCSSNPLPSNIVFCDESTMVDIELMHHLLSAIKAGAKIVFIGDYKQLPSVSPGNCFLDILNSEYINVVTLDVVKRQGAQSGLLKNANRIINGEMIETEKEIGDSFFLQAKDNDEILNYTLKSIKRLLEKGYSFEEVQVLVPMRKTKIGAHYMNYIIQETFNPKKSEKQEQVLSNEFVLNEKIYKLYFRVGDKVIHIKNNIEMQWHNEHGLPTEEYGINNGECGVIKKIYREKIGNNWKTLMQVQYEDGIMIYEDNFNELEHSYALTIHKSQGSQWKAVLLPFSNSFYPMFQNNLFYTGWTRATEFAAAIGQYQAIQQTIKTFTVTKRNSYLKERLIELKDAA